MKRAIGVAPLVLAAAFGTLAGLLATGTPAARAQEGQLELLGQLGGPTVAATWYSGRVLTGIGPRLLVLDGCDPRWPIEAYRSAPLGGVVRHVAARDGLAFVATGRGGLNVFALEPRPRHVGQLPLDGVASKVVLQGSLAYVASGAAGMSVVDIAEPGQPRLVGRFVDARGDAVIATDLAVGGSYAYVVSRNLMQVDIRDPSRPSLARKVEDWADAVAVVGSRLVVAPSETGERGERFGQLRVYDIAEDRHPPRLLASLPVGDRARRLAALPDGRIFYQGADRLLAFQHDGAGGLSPSGAVATPDSVLNLDFGGRWVWLGAGSSGLRAVDASGGLEGKTLITVLTSLARPKLIAQSDLRQARAHRLFVEDEGSGNAWGPPNRIVVVDVPDPLAAGGDPRAPVDPVLVGSFPAVVDKAGLVAHRTRLLVGAPEETLRVYDVADPSRVRELASLPMPRDPVSGRRAPIWRIAVEDDLAYLANDEWLRVLDLSQPAAPREVAAWRSTGGATDLAVDDRRAYLLGPSTGIQTGRPSLQIVDLFDLGDPLAFGTLDAMGFRGGIQAAGGRVYIEGLQIVEVGDPDAPAQWSRVELEGRTRDNAYGDGFVYLARSRPEGGGELRAFDVRSPGAPVETARVELIDEARDVVLSEDRAYVTALDAGLLVYRTGLSAPGPTLVAPPTATLTPRPALPERIHLPIVARGGLGRCD